MKPKKQPQSARQFIDNASLEQMSCRAFRHAWQVDGGTVEMINGQYHWTMPCLRGCGTTRTTVMTRTGYLVRTYYKWERTYHVKGGMDKAQLSQLRNALRKALFQ